MKKHNLVIVDYDDYWCRIVCNNCGARYYVDKSYVESKQNDTKFLKAPSDCDKIIARKMKERMCNGHTKNT